MIEGFATVDPLTMKVHVEGYGDMTEDVAKALAEIRIEQQTDLAVAAKTRQAMIARDSGEAVNLPYGHVVAQVDEAIYQHWVDRYGPKFWSDKNNRKHFLRDNPECAVRSRARTTSLRLASLPAYRVNDRRGAAEQGAGSKEQEKGAKPDSVSCPVPPAPCSRTGGASCA